MTVQDTEESSVYNYAENFAMVKIPRNQVNTTNAENFAMVKTLMYSARCRQPWGTSLTDQDDAAQRRGAASSKGGESRCTATGGARARRKKGEGGLSSGGGAAE